MSFLKTVETAKPQRFKWDILDDFQTLCRVDNILLCSSRMNENMEFPGATGEYIEWLQNSFVQIIQAEVSESAKNPFIKKEERGKVP